MKNNCICNGPAKCHLGRKHGDEAKKLCDSCIAAWFDEHLKHRIEQLLAPQEAEAKYIAGRSLVQFLGLTSTLNGDAGEYVLKLEDGYKFVVYPAMPKCGTCGQPNKVTFEVRAENLGGQSFTGRELNEFKAKCRDRARILAHFHQGANVHTAHLTWGANHSDEGVVWSSESSDDELAIKALCDLLKERVYKERDVPWNEMYALKVKRRIG